MPATPAEIARRALAGRIAPPAELLARYAAGRDPDAFAALVRQFGPLVLGTCRRVLGQSPDADDAFQTVFLALARRAGSFRDPATLPAWLHRVALRTARQVRPRHRPAPHGTAEPVAPTDPFATVVWRDVRRILDEELDALPDKLRGPVLLCWLDGLTRDEAASVLGVPLGTLKRRLSEGRELLRERLTRRGLAPALAACAVLAPDGLRADVPRPLAEAVADAARRVPMRSAVSVWAAVAAAVAACGVALVTAGHAPPEVAPPPRAAVALERPAGLPDVPLPAGAVARFGSMHFSAPDRIFSAARSPDGTRLALGDGLTVRVYESTTWRLLHTLAADGGPDAWQKRQSLAFSPDGNRLAYAQNGKLALTWDLTTGRLTRRFDRDGWVWQGFCAFTPDGLLALSDEEELRFFDPVTGAEKHAVGVPNAIALSPDGKHYLRHTGRAGAGTLVLGNATTGVDLHRLDTAVGSEPEVSFSPDGTRFVLMTRYGAAVEVWDVAKRALVKRLPAPPQPTDGERSGYGAAFTPDGREFWLKLPGNDLMRWDAATFLELPRFAPGTSQSPLTIAPLPDGRTVLVPCDIGRVLVFDRQTGRERPVPGRYRDAAFALSPDDKFVAVGDASGRIDLLNAATGRLERVVRESGDPVHKLVFGPNGRTLGAAEVVYNGIDLTKDRAAVRVYDTTDGKELRAQKRDGAKDREYRSHWPLLPLGFTATDRMVISRYPQNTRLWDFKTGKHTDQLAASNIHAALSPDGTLLATEEHGEAVITDVATGRETARVEVDPEEKANRRFGDIMRFAWAGDGNTLAASAPGGNVCLIDPRKGRVRTRINVARGGDWRFSFLHQPLYLPFSIQALALSPNGQQLLASARGGYYVALWDTGGRGKRLAKLECEFSVHGRGATFSSDGKRLFTFSSTGFGYSWDVENTIAAPKN
ncbi:ECF RNA polymerase sigma factor SigE [Gemmata obscuriglobus]|uniref:RNA polymerase sigma factor n=1 Tax=Gemmata obscuriglobus TaxID=114 RepID=A0A2Z3H3Y6_9BACT|nr:sigma-70 family RNA polymerase sigma factor [Gemmata obscuriglobus]AWM36334.1 RNA polymerase sigma factor [Gemmata obscuriglobus]QEG31054.1 ECF RNA polymerase sigma factor SigE [Gemmata obscuriglobus]VTS10391.1 wd-40 repeat-containing protein : Uncultured bacterium genome assembly Metasoil_fosmids_resub OS=uncultured bacterium PE=4 SV=1: Sigma70_r2: Sigma70_r4_2 [Gemmata obscuriglobus UQM 2246]